MELQGHRGLQDLKECQEKMVLWVSSVQEEIQGYQVLLDLLGHRAHRVFKGCKEEKDLQVSLDQLDHQEEAFLMVKFGEYAEQFWKIILLLSLKT